MSVDNEAEKVLWSLQNNKRTESERSVFKPNGKTPKKKNGWRYIFSVLGILLIISFLLTFFVDKPMEVCPFKNFCIHSGNNPVSYTVFVFTNLVIVVFGIWFAYRIGHYLGKKVQL